MRALDGTEIPACEIVGKHSLPVRTHFTLTSGYTGLAFEILEHLPPKNAAGFLQYKLRRADGIVFNATTNTVHNEDDMTGVEIIPSPQV